MIDKVSFGIVQFYDGKYGVLKSVFDFYNTKEYFIDTEYVEHSATNVGAIEHMCKLETFDQALNVYNKVKDLNNYSSIPYKLVYP